MRPAVTPFVLRYTELPFSPLSPGSPCKQRYFTALGPLPVNYKHALLTQAYRPTSVECGCYPAGLTASFRAHVNIVSLLTYLLTYFILLRASFT